MEKDEVEEPDEDKSELEEEIEKSEDKTDENNIEDFDRDRFRNFVGNWSMEDVTPSLERTNTSMVNLEEIEEVQNQTPNENAEEKKETNYEVKYTNADDYRNIEEMHWRANKDFVVREPSPININEMEVSFAPRTRNFQINPELQELRQSERQLERDYVAKAKRIENDDRLPFETQKKYQPRV